MSYFWLSYSKNRKNLQRKTFATPKNKAGYQIDQNIAKPRVAPMSIVNEHEESTTPVGKLNITAETVGRVRDMIIVKLKAMDIPERTIAKILGIKQSSVNKRYKMIPEEVRKFYGRSKMGELAGADPEG